MKLFINPEEFDLIRDSLTHTRIRCHNNVDNLGELIDVEMLDSLLDYLHAIYNCRMFDKKLEEIKRSRK